MAPHTSISLTTTEDRLPRSESLDQSRQGLYRSSGRDASRRGLVDARPFGRGARRSLPLSDCIYAEVSKIQRHRQRSDLREVIERVSGYRVVTSRSVVTAHEVEALLDVIVGPSPDPINTMDYLDWGVARAFGMVGGFRVMSASGEDVTDQARAAHRGGPEAFDHLLATAELNLNRQVIEGPTPEEEPELRAHGYDPAAAYAVAERRAAQEIEQAARFDNEPRWRRGRIRDVIAAREVYIEINTELSRGFEVRGATLEETLSNPQRGPRGVQLDAQLRRGSDAENGLPPRLQPPLDPERHPRRRCPRFNAPPTATSSSPTRRPRQPRGRLVWLSDSRPSSSQTSRV
jgi:hypothetical protein